MKNLSVIILLLISFALAVTLGMLDYETESLIHLFTSEPGNMVALLIYTGLFFATGWIILWLVRSIVRLVK